MTSTTIQSSEKKYFQLLCIVEKGKRHINTVEFLSEDAVEMIKMLKKRFTATQFETIINNKEIIINNKLYKLVRKSLEKTFRSFDVVEQKTYFGHTKATGKDLIFLG